MSITVTNIVAGPYTATGAAQTVAFAFKVFTPSEIEVMVGAPLDAVPLDPDLYEVTSNTALDGQVQEGGTVLIEAGALSAGASIRLVAKPADTQGQSYSDTGSRLKNLNEGFDRAALRALRLNYDLNLAAGNAADSAATAVAAAADAVAAAADAVAATADKVDRANVMANIRDYGAKGNGRTASGAIMLAGTNVVNCATANWSALTDLGKIVMVEGAGVAGANFISSVLAVNSPTQIVTAASASTNVGASVVRWGTNDRPAILEAKAVGNGLYGSAGNYFCHGDVGFITSGDDGFTIKGDGEFQTRFFFTAGNDGFTYESTSISSARGQFLVDSVGIVPCKDFSGAGISGKWAAGSNLTPTLTVLNSSVFSEYGGYYTKLITGDNAKNGTIIARLLGNIAGGVVRTTHAVHLTGASTIFHIPRPVFSAAGYGVLVEGDSEGIYITDPEIIQVEYGVVHDARGGSDSVDPGLQVNGGHINASKGCVRGRGSIGSMARGVLCYSNGDAPVGADWFAVKWGDGSRNTITSDIICENLPGTAATTKAIVLEDGSGHTVSGQMYGGATPMTVGVEIGAAVTGSKINILTNGQVTTPVSDLSGGVNEYCYDLISLSRTATLKAVAGNTGVIFDTEENLSTAAVTTKTVNKAVYGRDTGNTRKEALRYGMTPVNSNLTQTSFDVWVRDADVLANHLTVSPPASGETSLLARVNLGGTLVMVRLLIGGPDTAGTGFRAIRTVN